MQVRFSNIVWDTDGEKVDLPQEAVLNVPDGTDLAEEGADFLSDRFGWLVESCSFAILTDTDDNPKKAGR
jgi:hypothetical protein